MFLDVSSLIFYSLCVVGFLLGLGITKLLTPRLSPICFSKSRIVYPARLLIMPLLIGTFVCILSCILMVRAYPNLIALLWSAEGYQLKQNEEVFQIPLGLANTWLLGILWWAIWRYNQMQPGRWARRVIKLCFLVAFTACTVSSALQLSRGELMPIIAGSAIVYLLTKLRRKPLSSKFILVYAIVAAVAVVGLFLLFSALRGLGSQRFLADLVAYSIASYNRLSAVIHGRIVYPYAGRGIYLWSFLGFNNMLNGIVPFRDWLHWPSFLQVWQSEFNANWNAGLNRFVIWSGAFGYIFSEIGWFSPLYLLLYGMLYGVVWRSVKRGHLLGILLYPWFAFCILFWFGMNYLFDNKLIVLLLDVVFLTAYEYIALRRSPLPKVPADAALSAQAPV